MKSGLIKILALLMILLLVQCGSDSSDTDDPPDPPPPGTYTLKVDGVDWTANLGVAANMISGVISISGSASDGTRCNITLYNISAPGNYGIGGTSTNSAQWIKGNGADDTYETRFGEGAGTISIIQISAANIAGSFQFNAHNPNDDEVIITDGLFNALF